MAALIVGGNNVTLLPSDPRVNTLIDESQFRGDLATGRGPGMVSVMGTEQRVRDLMKFCQELSVGGKRIVSNVTDEPIENSEGRGLRQMAADLLGLGVLSVAGKSDSVDYDQWVDQRNNLRRRLNMRLWRGWMTASQFDKERLSEILPRFEGLGLLPLGQKPTSLTAGVHRPERTIWPLWLYLTGRLSE